MQTITLSVRLPKEDAGKMGELARDLNMERSAFLKRALKRGAEDLRFEYACEAYRKGQASLSRAAEMAGLRVRDMLLRLRDAGLELNYDVSDLQKDIRE